MDLCNKCFKDVDVATFDREDLDDESFTTIYEDLDYNELGVLIPFTGEYDDL
jgi:hypothetical protein